MTLIFDQINIYPLLKAKKKFEESYARAEDEFDRAGVIKYFEICYELTWTSLKKILKYKGIESARSPRDVFREAAVIGIIDDPELWFGFLHDRNLTVHTYNEDTAELIFKEMEGFSKELNRLVERLMSLKP